MRIFRSGTSSADATDAPRSACLCFPVYSFKQALARPAFWHRKRPASQAGNQLQRTTYHARRTENDHTRITFHVASRTLTAGRLTDAGHTTGTHDRDTAQRYATATTDENALPGRTPMTAVTRTSYRRQPLFPLWGERLNHQPPAWAIQEEGGSDSTNIQRWEPDPDPSPPAVLLPRPHRSRACPGGSPLGGPPVLYTPSIPNGVGRHTGMRREMVGKRSGNGGKNVRRKVPHACLHLDRQPFSKENRFLWNTWSGVRR